MRCTQCSWSDMVHISYVVTLLVLKLKLLGFLKQKIKTLNCKDSHKPDFKQKLNVGQNGFNAEVTQSNL